MDVDNDGASTSTAHASATRRFKAYFPPPEVASLITANAGKLTPARIEAMRQLACGLIDSVGGRLGFPRRTIATAQVLYHRFHLFFPLKDFAVQDVAVACLLASSKLEDTLKKLREVQIAAYQVKAAQEGVAAFQEPDPHSLESDRARLIGIERLILETISFNFNLRSNAAYATREATSTTAQTHDVFAYVIKLGRHFGASKDFVKRAFRLAIDAHRTVLPLSYPPHAIAAACLYLTSFLTSNDAEAGAPDFDQGWSESIHCEMDTVEDICHGILDLLLSVGPTSGKFGSPSESLLLPVQSPREASVPKLHTGAALASELTQIKIRLRDDAAKRKDGSGNGEAPRPPVPSRTSSTFTGTGISAGQAPSDAQNVETDRILGRDDVTIRFVWA